MAEAERAIRRVHSDDTDRPRRQLGIYNEAFPLAMTALEDGDCGGVELPDPDDRHVVAGAVASGCDVIVTYNLKDFSKDALAAKGVRAVHPDEFLAGLAEGSPEEVHAAVLRIVASKRRPPRTMAEELEGLRANRLSRFADFVEAREGKSGRPVSPE